MFHTTTIEISAVHRTRIPVRLRRAVSRLRQKPRDTDLVEKTFRLRKHRNTIFSG